MSDTDILTEDEVIVQTSKPAPVSEKDQPKPKRQPQYAVVVLDDDLHTFDYVIEALMRICGHSAEQSFRLAKEIDSNGLAIVWTGTMELAELKRDQIRGYCPDHYPKVPVTFPLGCYIEPLA